MTSEPSKNASASVTLSVIGQQVPSFKNRKRISRNLKTGKPFLRTREDIKQRMDNLEDAILSALLSESQIIEGETHSECWKRLRTLLCGLLDDSIREIPCGNWSTEYVPKGQEGVIITIKIHDDTTCVGST